MPTTFIPDLPESFEPTRATLHAYAHGVGAISRAHGIAHPNWWHISLKPRPEGLSTDSIPLPGGGSLVLTMDLATHKVVMRTSTGENRSFDMRSGATGTEFATQLIAAAAEQGLEDGYQRDRFESDEPREYETAAAEAFGLGFENAAIVLDRHRSALGSRVGPIQVWPHGFDIAFEWFGSTVHQHEGEMLPSQVNFGWYPRGRSYFYANPWPFDESLTRTGLPGAARWQTQGWNGSILYSDDLAGDDDPSGTVVDYLAAVHAAAAPLLAP